MNKENSLTPFQTWWCCYFQIYNLTLPSIFAHICAEHLFFINSSDSQIMPGFFKTPYLAPHAPQPSGPSWQPSLPWTHGPLWLHWWAGSQRRMGGTGPYSLTLQKWAVGIDIWLRHSFPHKDNFGDLFTFPLPPSSVQNLVQYFAKNSQP